MILQAFRQHLAAELARFPAKPEEAFESYAVTTAALARQIIAYLDIDDLAVPNGFNDDPPEYPLREVLNRIIHFRVLHPDAITFNYPGKPDLVTLYSDRTQDRREHQYIRLNEYVEVAGRLANDDLYVARHLFRRAVTQIHIVMNAMDQPVARREEIRQAEFRKRLSRMVGNAWNMLDHLVESGELTCPATSVDCYEWRDSNEDETNLVRFSPIATCEHLLRRDTPWIWGSFTPSKERIGGHERYCMPLSAYKSATDRTFCILFVTFDSYIRIFQDARRQLDRR